MLALYEDFIRLRTYARWIEEEGRREDWAETVLRYADYFALRLPKDNIDLSLKYLKTIRFIMNKTVMPSMRALWTAGPALDVDNIAGYNCSYTVIDKPKAFAEVLYILLQGTGVGFSVEKQYINQLPTIPSLKYSPEVILFDDSKLGWATGINNLITRLFSGFIPMCDLSRIRAAGSRLRTFGGRASGPEPLYKLINFTIQKFKDAQGRKLTSVEAYDICCMIAEIVVVGGVRRSALISLSNLDDDEMRDCKTAEAKYWDTAPWRQNSNNSAVYLKKPSFQEFETEWKALVMSGCGERGIVNREGMMKSVPKRRDNHHNFGVNPCGEIILRPNSFCNLTEVVIKEDDTLDVLLDKVESATILGCLQSTLTDFNFLDPVWKKNCEEERLLGVSLTGLMDHPTLSQVSRTAQKWLSQMKMKAQDVAEEWSKALGINMPTAITCVKPSGTVSQLVGSGSGLHPWYAPHFIRRVRVDSKDPLAKLMIDQGVPHDEERKGNVQVFSFPMAAPTVSNCVKDVTAITQLEYWKQLKTHWCEHNPSCTIYVKPEEWDDVGAWVWSNWDSVGGLSFFPFFDDVEYLNQLKKAGKALPLLPYETISEQTYNDLVQAFPKVDFSVLKYYEKEDETQGSREYACVGGACTF